MFDAIFFVINTLSNERVPCSQPGDVEAAYLELTSFNFVLIYLMKKDYGNY